MKFLEKVKESRPEILMTAGFACIVGSIIFTRKAAKKENDILEGANKTIDTIHKCQEDLDYNDDISEEERSKEEKELKSDLVKVYAQTGGQLAKNYIPAIGLGVVGMICLFTSHRMLKERNAALTIAYTGLITMVQDYRKRVAKELGNEKERDLYFNIKEEEIETVTVDEKGKEKKKKEKVKVVDYADILDSPYSVFFDSSSRNYKDDPEYNKTFLVQMQKFFNDKLSAEGVVYLNDIYRELDVKPENNLPYEGWLVGWHKDCPNSDEIIDFGLADSMRQTVRRFVNGYEPVVLLDFNCTDISEYLPKMFS